MAEKNNATCAICGEPYYVCMSCRDSLKISPWKIHTDTPNCYKVYQVVHGFSTGVYTKDEAKDKLKNIDLGNLNSFRPHIKKIIKDILKEDKFVTKTVEKVELVEPTVKTEIVEVEEEKVEKPIVSRKRNFKVEAE